MLKAMTSPSSKSSTISSVAVTQQQLFAATATVATADFNPNGIQTFVQEGFGVDVALESLSTFQYIEETEYKGQAGGLAMQDESMPCDCQYAADVDDLEQDACGSNCINRMLCVECVDRDCPVGPTFCRNRKFQRHEYASVEIFRTKNKGYGIRAREDIPKKSFVIEYIGEVITLSAFRKRTKQYEEQNQKHFYFMSLKKDEIIDATARGGIARFVNHSCEPNCELQKWSVGRHLKVGIFTRVDIKKGQELSFDYKFERYGAPCQVCLCGAPSCKGTIGVSRDSNMIVDDFSGDESDSESDAKGKKGSAAAKGLDTPEMVPVFTQAIFQADKPYKLNKLLDRLIATDSLPVLRRFVQLHGLLVLKSLLRTFSENSSICRKVINALQKVPILTRNTIEDSQLDKLVEALVRHKDVIISTLASKITDDWSKLEKVYRIPKAPKKKQEPKDDAPSTPSATMDLDTWEQDRAAKRLKSDDSQIYRRDSTGSSFKGYSKDGGYPRGKVRNFSRFAAPPSALPLNWRYSHTPEGELFYYHAGTGATQWDLPTEPKEAPSRSSAESSVTSEMLAKVAEKAQQAMEAERQAKRQAELEQAQAEEEERRLKEEKRLKLKELRSKEKDKSRKSHHKHHSDAKSRSSSRSDQSERSSSKSSKDKHVDAPADPIKPDSAEELDLKKFREEISSVVVKYFSAHRDKMDTEMFKKHARKVTHLVIEKETREKTSTPLSGDDLKRKVKKFVESYVEKLLLVQKSNTPST